MYVRAKRIAVLGLFIALNVLLLFLTSIFEFNTLFLLGAASFTMGIAVKENGLKLGIGFFIANTFVCFITAPNKLYCLTLMGMGIYLLFSEWISNVMIRKYKKIQNIFIWLPKLIFFNCLYIPLVILAPGIIYAGSMNQKAYLFLILGGQIVVIIYDLAYQYFINTFWARIHKFMNE